MRHNVTGKRLGRTTNQRKALMKNLATSLITHERVETTLVKAKELRQFVEPFIRLGSKSTVTKLFDATFRARFDGRPGGYTRILKTDHRLGDAADMAIIEFVDYVLPEPKEAEPAE